MFELHKDEKVILYIRRHWIFLFFETKLIFLLFLTPVIFVWALQYFSLVPDINLLGVSIYSVSDILIYLWGLFCWMLLAEKFTDYALDFWVVTNKRIIESELNKLFDVQISTLELQDIEDLTVFNKGFWANLIGYGRLEVQTAGAVNEFFAERIMNPSKVQQIIFDAKLAHQKEEKDIEKVEFEQISQRVFKEEKEISPATPASAGADATPSKEGESQVQQDFDWAHRSEENLERQEIEKETGFIEDKYKQGLGEALKSGE